MKKIQQLIKFLTNQNYRFGVLTKLGLHNHLTDEQFIKRRFKSIFGYEPNLQNPQTF